MGTNREFWDFLKVRTLSEDVHSMRRVLTELCTCHESCSSRKLIYE